MFCSKCGNQLSAGLNYCNRCGAPVYKTGNLSESLAYIGGGGFVCFIFVVLILVKNQVPADVLLKISFLYLATLFGICFLILWHAKGSPGKNAPEKSDSRDFVPPVELPAQNTNQLHEYREPAITVTEETTRNFDKVPLKES